MNVNNEQLSDAFRIFVQAMLFPWKHYVYIVFCSFYHSVTVTFSDWWSALFILLSTVVCYSRLSYLMFFSNWCSLLSRDLDMIICKKKTRYASRVNVYFQNGGADDKKRQREKEGTKIVKS